MTNTKSSIHGLTDIVPPHVKEGILGELRKVADDKTEKTKRKRKNDDKEGKSANKKTKVLSGNAASATVTSAAVTASEKTSADGGTPTANANSVHEDSFAGEGPSTPEVPSAAYDSSSIHSSDFTDVVSPRSEDSCGLTIVTSPENALSSSQTNAFSSSGHTSEGPVPSMQEMNMVNPPNTLIPGAPLESFLRPDSLESAATSPPESAATAPQTPKQDDKADPTSPSSQSVVTPSAESRTASPPPNKVAPPSSPLNLKLPVTTVSESASCNNPSPPPIPCFPRELTAEVVAKSAQLDGKQLTDNHRETPTNHHQTLSFNGSFNYMGPGPQIPFGFHPNPYYAPSASGGNLPNLLAIGTPMAPYNAFTQTTNTPSESSESTSSKQNSPNAADKDSNAPEPSGQVHGHPAMAQSPWFPNYPTNGAHFTGSFAAYPVGHTDGRSMGPGFPGYGLPPYAHPHNAENNNNTPKKPQDKSE